MVKGRYAPTASRPLTRFKTLATNHLARFAIALTPEQLSLYEGCRAALVTALALVPSLVFDKPLFAWSAFSCFWACLIDPGGPDRERFRVLVGFALLGSLAAGSVAWLTGLSGFLVFPLVGLVGLVCGLARVFSPAVMQLWVLAGCAALAATGFAATLQEAIQIALLFLSGGLLATLFCLVLWRQQPFGPARRSLSAVFSILELMARELSVGRVRETVHRQAARNAIERARTLIVVLDASRGNARVRRRLDAALAAAERIFTAFLALEHMAEKGALSEPLRHLLACLAMTCHEAMRQVARTEPDFRILRQLALDMAREARNGTVPSARPIIASAEAIIQMVRAFEHHGERDEDIRAIRSLHISPAVWRHTARLSLALTATQVLCRLGGEGFSYWALIATLLVMQPAGASTLARSIERVIGSVAGSLLAALCAFMLPGKPGLLLAAVFLSLSAIAVRAVNYTLLVLFLTGLIVVIAEAVMPGQGIVWARVLDNILGSAVGLVCVLFLWPEREDTDRDALRRRAIALNFRYAALVLAGDVAPGETDSVQRRAGIATIAAEFSRDGLPLLGGLVMQLQDTQSRERQAALRGLRRLSGEMTLYRFDRQNGLRQPDPEASRHMLAWAEELERGQGLDHALEALRQDSLPLKLAPIASDQTQLREAAPERGGQLLDP